MINQIEATGTGWLQLATSIKPSILALIVTASLLVTPLDQKALAQATGNPPPDNPIASDQPIPAGLAVLNATNYQPIPAGSSFDTVIQDPANPDGTALDNAVLDRVNKELGLRGYHVARDAPMVMLVGGDLVRGASKDAVVDKLKGIGNTQNEKQGNVFSTNGDTLLTRTTPDTRPNTFRIQLSIYNRQTGIYLWRGSIDRGTSNLTPDQATDRMVPPLVGAIGRSEQNRNVDIGITAP